MKWWILLLLILAGLFIVLPLFVRLVRFFCWNLYFIFCWFSWKPQKKDGNQAGTIKNTEPDAEQAGTNDKNEPDAEQAAPNEKNIKNTIKGELLWLRMQMERTNFWFHLVRNNPRHREQYYFALIAIVGYENWKNVNDTVRMNWESARLSFDRMYGMVKDFAEYPEEYTGLFEAKKQESSAPEVPADQTNQLNEIHIDLTKKLEGISSELDKKLENLTKLLPPQDKMKEVRDALNAWIPPEDKADKE